MTRGRTAGAQVSLHIPPAADNYAGLMETELIGDGHAPDEPGRGEPSAEFDRIGPYRVLQKLGEGGMGVVHLALDARGKAVAVKVLRPHVADDADARRRLAREVESLGRVRSPRVAPVFDANLDATRPYIVTRYVPGPSLDSAIRADGPLGPEALVRVGRGLTEALESIHQVGVVHRDLKPGNVLLLDGDPVVIDFGIAHVAEASRMTMAGLVMGTPGYLSPEIVEGAEVGPATDWWGWAATLAFAASGRPPFGRGGMEAVLSRVCRGEADLRGVDPALAPLLNAALDPDADRRPNASEVLRALEAYAGGRPVTTALPERSRTFSETRVLPAQPAPVTPTRPAPVAPAPARAAGPVDAWGNPVHPAYQSLAPAPPPRTAPPAGPPAPQAWPSAADGRSGDPRIGLPDRSDVLAALGLLVVAVAATAPAAALVGVLLWSWVARTLDRSMTATVMRRHRSGVRRSDPAVAMAASPWHAVTGAAATLFAAIFPAVVGGSAVLATAIAQSLYDDAGIRLGSQLPLAAGAAIGVLVAWFGPAAPSLRRGSRTMVRSVTGSDLVRRVLVAVLALTALGVLAAVAVGGIDVSWWPLAESPLPGPSELPSR